MRCSSITISINVSLDYFKASLIFPYIARKLPTRLRRCCWPIRPGKLRWTPAATTTTTLRLLPSRPKKQARRPQSWRWLKQNPTRPSPSLLRVQRRTVWTALLCTQSSHCSLLMAYAERKYEPSSLANGQARPQRLFGQPSSRKISKPVGRLAVQHDIGEFQFPSCPPCCKLASMLTGNRLFHIAQSNLLLDLDENRCKLKTAESRRSIIRTTAFEAHAPAVFRLGVDTAARTEKGKAKQVDLDDELDDRKYTPQGNERDDDLALVHRLEPGPKDFKPFDDDPTWQEIEPNSGIRLKWAGFHPFLYQGIAD